MPSAFSAIQHKKPKNIVGESKFFSWYKTQFFPHIRHFGKSSLAIYFSLLLDRHSYCWFAGFMASQIFLVYSIPKSVFFFKQLRDFNYLILSFVKKKPCKLLASNNYPKYKFLSNTNNSFTFI